MSLDRSLKSGGGLARHRNVLSRPERIEKLASRGQFNKDGGDPLGLPKVANRKLATGGSKGPKKEAAAEAGKAAPAEKGKK